MNIIKNTKEMRFHTHFNYFKKYHITNFKKLFKDTNDELTIV